MFTTDELRDVAHRSGTIEGIHSDEVLEDGGLQFAQILLHACRLKLERTNGAPLLIELVGFRVIDGNVVEVDVDASVLLDDGTGFLHLAQSLQTEEVHLDKTRRLDDMAVILRAVGLHEAAGMNARTTHSSLEHLGIFDGVGQSGIRRCLGFLQLTHGTNGVRKIHLRRLATNIGQAVGDSLAQGIRHRQRHLLHACHILDAILRGHRGISDDMGAVLMTVFVFHPLQHTATTVVVEVGIDIG